MKPSSQSNKSNTSNSKVKKSSRDREKRKSQAGAEVNNHVSAEKGSPTKESNTRLYAGIDSESLLIYSEQCEEQCNTEEQCSRQPQPQLSEVVSNIITEDINYRLRYIINDALIKARLSGRNAISSQDIEETFHSLRIEPVYGASAHPNWVPFGHQNLFYLDDKIVNLAEITEQDSVYYQRSEVVITKQWLHSKSFRKYFTTVCQAVVKNDSELRQFALNNVLNNTKIGPISEWFYNFGYILLSKDITYDSLTLRGLDLIDALENNPVCRISVLEKQLILLVRLILQRLLNSSTAIEVLKPMCRVLRVLCNRQPLKEFVISKILQKMPEICEKHVVPVVTIISYLGVEALELIFLPKLSLFISIAVNKHNPHLTYSILELYFLICKCDLLDDSVYEVFHEVFGDALVAFQTPKHFTVSDIEKRDVNFSAMKRNLLLTRRKLEISQERSPKGNIADVFEMPIPTSKLGKKLEKNVKPIIGDSVKKGDLIIGKTWESLLLPVFRERKCKQFHRKSCCDHTLLQYTV